MSKVLFTVAIPHDGTKPQFVISTNNLYAIQVAGTDIAHPKFGNSNVNGFKHRFEYAVTGGKNVTRLSLVMNTTMVLPHLTWAPLAKKPIPPMPTYPEKKRRSHRSSGPHYDDENNSGYSSRTSRRHSPRPIRYGDGNDDGDVDERRSRTSRPPRRRYDDDDDDKKSRSRRDGSPSPRYSEANYGGSSRYDGDRKSRRSARDKRDSRRHHHGRPVLDDGNFEGEGGADAGDYGGDDGGDAGDAGDAGGGD